MDTSLAPSMQHTYASMESSYHSLCIRVAQAPFPASVQLLILFACPAGRALNNPHVLIGGEATSHYPGHRGPSASTLRLEYMLRGVHKGKPLSGRVRLLITPLILHDIRGVLAQCPHEYTHIILCAACCLGYVLCLSALRGVNTQWCQRTLSTRLDKQHHRTSP